MADPMEPEFTAQNPIVEAASRLRARRELGSLIDAATGEASDRKPEDAEESLAAFAKALEAGARRLNSIVGKRGEAVKVVTMQKPMRLRVRFRDQRIALDLDEVQQLVRIRGGGYDGDYQFDLSAPVPSLISLSKLSTEGGYGEALTASVVLKTIAQDAELPRPSHLDAPGPLQF